MSFVEALVIIVLIFAITMTIWLLIQKSSNDGKLIIEKDEESGKITLALEINFNPYEVEHMKNVSFKVVKK